MRHPYDCRCQTMIVLSFEAEASSVVSGAQATEFTGPLWPPSVTSGAPAWRAFQMATVWSAEPAASSAPSPDHETEVITSFGPWSVKAGGKGVLMFQTVTT